MFCQTSTYKDNTIHSFGCLKGLYLGNVLTVINDVITPLDYDTDLTVDSYQVGIVNVTDYSPFVAPLRSEAGEKGKLNDVVVCK